VVDAFLAASRGGDFAALLGLLDPDVVLRADEVVARMSGGPAEVRGADEVAATFAGRARAARLALIDGTPGAVWSQDGVPRVVFQFTVTGGTVSAIDMVADPDVLARLTIEPL
jgi:RNA polymerase sigma-70 factor (ECF subfamily)